MSEDLRSVRRDLVKTLNRIDDLIASTSKGDAHLNLDVVNMDRTKAIEAVLAHNGGVMRPVQVWAELRRLGRDDPKMQVQVTTFDLWKRGRIDKVGRGQYKAKDA
jgi:arsenate reductase-like glutaredoxin family protein